MVANAAPTDLIEVYAPLGARYQAGVALANMPPVRTLPALVHRRYCRPHLLLCLHRKVHAGNVIKDTSLDFVQETIIADAFEESVRRGEIKVFSVARPSSGTWDTCPHCRWQERKRDQLRQSHD